MASSRLLITAVERKAAEWTFSLWKDSWFPGWASLCLHTVSLFPSGLPGQNANQPFAMLKVLASPHDEDFNLALRVGLSHLGEDFELSFQSWEEGSAWTKNLFQQTSFHVKHRWLQKVFKLIPVPLSVHKEPIPGMRTLLAGSWAARYVQGLHHEGHHCSYPGQDWQEETSMHYSISSATFISFSARTISFSVILDISLGITGSQSVQTEKTLRNCPIEELTKSQRW